jgi:hypothetical protein
MQFKPYLFGVQPGNNAPRRGFRATSRQQLLRDLETLPRAFSWRDQIELAPVMNQQICECGCCWALSSSGALMDRFRIHGSEKQLLLNAAATTNCPIEPPEEYDPRRNPLLEFTRGCGGAPVSLAAYYFETVGLPKVSETCHAFDSFCTPTHPAIDTTLADLSDEIYAKLCQTVTTGCDHQRYKIQPGSFHTIVVTTDIMGRESVLRDETIAAIQLEIMKNGPIVSTFMVFADMALFAGDHTIPFAEATNGIYVQGAYRDLVPKDTGDAISSHAVETVGWGEGPAGKYGTVQYWIVKNSWGTTFADQGYFKIAFSNANERGNGINQHVGFDIPLKSRVGGELSCGTYAFNPLLPTVSRVRELYSPPRRKWWIIGVIVVLLIAIVLFLVLNYTNKR